MTNNNQQIPAIRFNGFTDAWEQRELKEILKVNSGRDYKHLGSGSIPVYGTGGYMLSVNDKLSDKDAIGIGRKGTIDKPQYLKAPFWTVDTLFFMIPLNNFDLQFLYTMTQKINWKKMDESTGVPSLSKAVIEKVNQNIPSYQEQTKIGTFFKQLDDTIALHQRQLPNYKELKKAMLQKMFPQEGEKVPELRFNGFTEGWEQCSLGELASFSKGYGYTKSDLADSGNPIILYGQLYTKYETIIDAVDTFAEEKEKSVVSTGNEVIVPASGETPEDIARASVVAQAGIILGGDLNIIKPKAEINSPFLALTISNGRQQIELSKKAQGKSIVHLHNSDLKEVNLVYPRNAEQTKIGNLFKSLDETIALHQKKINEYQTLKKSALQQMFI